MFHEKSKILHLRDGMSWKEKQIAVEMARLFGFQSESAVFPVVSREYGEEIPSELQKLEAFFERTKSQDLPKDYVAASDSAKPVEDFDWRVTKGLETLFSRGSILKDEDYDFLPDKMDVHFVLKDEQDASLLAAACTFAFRMGMETTSYDGLLLQKEQGEGNVIVFEQAQTCSVRFQEEKGSICVTVAGNGEELEAFVSDFCGQFPKQGAFDTWTDYMQEIIDAMSMRNLDGQLAYTKAFAKEGALAFVSPEIEKKREEIQSAFPGISFTNYKSEKKIYEKEYDIPWEVDCLDEMLENHVYPKLKTGDRVQVFGALSEGKEERSKIAGRIEANVSKAGAIGEVSIFCAYKQGYSWIEESVVPRLLQNKPIERIEIGFKPFLPEGVTDWSDEDGATPSYTNTDSDPDKWYDLPIRYLQELYPLEDMLAEQLQMNRENIHFHVYEGNADITYELKAFTEGDNLSCEDTYKATCSERVYLDAYPQLGKVHPSTGCIKVLVNGDVVLDNRIETDVERIWSIYQNEILPDCRTFIEEKTGGAITLDAQPFFSKLQIEVEASEPDFRLTCREDLFTTLDGLHEDIYFAGADYFKNYGMEKAGAILDAPGLILPVIKKCEGKPHLKVTLYDQEAQEPALVNKSSSIRAMGTRKSVQAWMEAVEGNGQDRTAVIRVEGMDESVVAAYAGLMEKGLLDIGKKLYHINRLEIRTEKNRYSVSAVPAQEPEKNLDIRDIDLSEKELIGYEKYMEIIQQLKQVPELNVYRTAVSYMGREIYAVEIQPDCEGYVSRTKRITKYPSEIINSRHHANEVSSTNSAFMLIKVLLTDEKYKEIANKLNLVIVPMENVDGAAIHYELQKDNPNWKLHVARFNAIGKEFYYEHFKTDTIHTEAMGLTRLFGSFLPDVIVDNHGVPSHEWEQQFSGYTSPSFKGFWLPRSLLYGYFWMVNDEAFKSNYLVNKKMEDVIAESISSDEEIAHWNKEWARQFEKFAHGWMPRLFPADYYKEMINYWIPFAYEPNHRYPSIRFPWITTVAYTSEVADETAQGEYLDLCARAHLNHDLSILEMMAGSTCVYKDKWNLSEDEIEAAHTRLRPVIV